MEKSIWKFALPVRDIFSLQMPAGAEILSVAAQGGNPRLWALVDPSADTELRNFEMFGTGHPVNCDLGADRKFLGTCLLFDGDLVYHVFEHIGV